MNVTTVRALGLTLKIAVSGLASLCLAGAQMALACEANKLGTSRIVPVGAEGGLNIGLKTYPQTLALADHEVVLTFDDGPSPATTPRILDALKAECVLATFFLIGRNAAAAPELVRREWAEGHTLGHHSMTHPAVTLRRLSYTAAQEDIEKGMEADDLAAYGAYTGTPRVPFFRFPGFGDSPELNTWLASRNIVNFGADFWASDWVPMTAQVELQLVLGRLEAEHRGIILFHDIKAQTATMLPDFLNELKRRGYHIVHLVPGPLKPELRPAPDNWSSETERTLKHMWP
eukprot:gene6571-6640_t